MNQQLKALILARVKKFLPSHDQLFVIIIVTFTSKAHSNLQGVFLTMIGFVTIGHLLFIQKRVAKGDKANHDWKTPCKLMCAFEIVKISKK